MQGCLFSFEDNQNKQCMIKIVTIGNESVGKESIVQRFCRNEFNQQQSIGCDFNQKIIEKDNLEMKIQLWFWNPSGRYYRQLSQKYFENSLGIIFVYDITKRKSFDELLQSIRNLPPNTSELAVRMILGNKSDLYAERQVSYKEGKQLAEQLGFMFFEVSAKDDNNIQKAINSLIEEIYSYSLLRKDNKSNKLGMELTAKQI